MLHSPLRHVLGWGVRRINLPVAAFSREAEDNGWGIGWKGRKPMLATAIVQGYKLRECVVQSHIG